MSNESKLFGKSELVYGLNGARIVHIDEVSSGLECQCTCPSCGALLVAKKGDKKTHHFAHYDSEECHSAPETALHLLAKDIIEQNRKLLVPAINSCSLGYKASEIASEVWEFESVIKETSVGSYIPDLLAIKDGEVIEVEILVTHAVNDEKALKAKQDQKKMLEIDLSGVNRESSPDQVKDLVLYHAKRYWVSNPDFKAITHFRDEVAAPSLASSEKKIFESYSNDAFMNDGVRVVLGFKNGSGYSPKYQNNFEIRKLYLSRPAQTRSTTNFRVSASGGYEVEEIDFDPECLHLLNSLSFPLAMRLEFGQKVQGRRLIPIVVGAEPV